MAVRDILSIGHPLLRQPGRTLSLREIRSAEINRRQPPVPEQIGGGETGWNTKGPRDIGRAAHGNHAEGCIGRDCLLVEEETVPAVDEGGAGEDL